MITLNNEDQEKLVKLFDTLIEEAQNEHLLIRGHKQSKDNGLSWQKTNRLAVFEQARELLIGDVTVEATEDQPSPQTYIRSKADVDPE